MKSVYTAGYFTASVLISGLFIPYKAFLLVVSIIRGGFRVFCEMAVNFITGMSHAVDHANEHIPLKTWSDNFIKALQDEDSVLLILMAAMIVIIIVCAMTVVK